MVDTREFHIVGSKIHQDLVHWLVLFDTKYFTVDRYYYPRRDTKRIVVEGFQVIGW